MYLQENNWMLIGLLAVFLTGCYKEKDYYYSSSDILEQLTVEIEHDSIPADGTSSTKITYSFPVEVDPSLTSLLLVTSKGTFLESGDDSLTVNFVTLNANEENRIVEVTLVSSTGVGNCVISAHVQNYVKKDTLYFSKAHVSEIELSSPTFFIKNDTITSISFESKLKSATGLASSGQTVFFESPLSHGISGSGTAVSNALGKANFEFIFTDTAYVGTLLFVTKAINQIGDTITATKSIQVID